MENQKKLWFRPNPNKLDGRPERKLWFRRKCYGWGWYPVSWEGWLTTLLYVLGLVFIFKDVGGKYSSGGETFTTIILPFIILTAILIGICYIKGESPKWQWAKPTNEVGRSPDLPVVDLGGKPKDPKDL